MASFASANLDHELMDKFVMFKLSTKLRFEPEEVGKQWLLQIARHRCWDHLRATQRHEVTHRPEALQEAIHRLGRDMTSRREREQDLAEAINCLPIRQQQSVRLFYLEGFSIAEIARRMQRRPGTIKKWLHHARRGLRTELYGPENTGDTP